MLLWNFFWLSIDSNSQINRGSAVGFDFAFLDKKKQAECFVHNVVTLV